MDNLFNQVMTMYFVSSVIFISGVIVWLKNNNNSFKEVLGKVQSLQMRMNEMQKVIDVQSADIVYLRSQVLKHKTEIDQVQEYNAKIKDQMQILSRRQKYLKEKMIPQKVIIEASSDLSKQYAKHFTTIKKQLKDL